MMVICVYCIYGVALLHCNAVAPCSNRLIFCFQKLLKLLSQIKGFSVFFCSITNIIIWNFLATSGPPVSLYSCIMTIKAFYSILYNFDAISCFHNCIWQISQLFVCSNKHLVKTVLPKGKMTPASLSGSFWRRANIIHKHHPALREAADSTWR